MTLLLSHATIRFLEDVNVCWGAGWVRALTRAITDGTLVELDGESCVVECNPTPESEGGEICNLSRGNKSQLRMEI